MPSTYTVAFWNLENLFDEQHAPRTDKLQRAIGRDLAGWTPELRDRKVAQLAAIIQQLNDGRGPDLLGVCEVENHAVLDLLVQALAPLGRDYAVEHHDTADQRGIDVAFIYDRALFTAEQQFSHFVMRRTATRDLLQVNFRTHRGRLLVVVGNHWPSRSGGEEASAAYRAMAGETLAYFHQRILEVEGKTTPVLALGDFNDEPHNPSLVDFALSTRTKAKVTNARNAMFLNLMWPLLGQGLGSFSFDNVPNMLDQVLVNKNLLTQRSPLRVVEGSAQVVRLPEMTARGEYPRPIPFGGMGKPLDPNGYSDHFPVTVTLTEAD